MTIVTEKELLRKSKHILRLVTFFFQKIVQFKRQCAKIWYSQTGHRRQYNTAHALCMLGNKVYRHTLRICKKNYFFCTATTLMRTRLVVTLTFTYMASHALCYSFPCRHDPTNAPYSYSFTCYCHHKDKRAKPENIPKKEGPFRKSEKIGRISIFLIFLPAKVKAT
jgi:hypothetical protein